MTIDEAVENYRNAFTDLENALEVHCPVGTSVIWLMRGYGQIGEVTGIFRDRVRVKNDISGREYLIRAEKLTIKNGGLIL